MGLKCTVVCTVTCDIRNCQGGVGGGVNQDIRPKPSGDPASLPSGWTYVRMIASDTSLIEEVIVCPSCYPRVHRWITG